VSIQKGVHSELSERQAAVLRAVVAAYIGEAAAVGSETLSHLLPVALSSASIRNTLAELSDLGFLDKAHASAGRVPTQRGLRLFVDVLMHTREPDSFERREIEGRLRGAEGEDVVALAPQVLSDRTHQLGFALLPRLARALLRHVSLVRLSSERVLVILVSQSGKTYRRLLEDCGDESQAQLDAMASALFERVVGRTLHEARTRLAAEASFLRSRADHLLRRAVELGTRAVADAWAEESDLVLATCLALMDQPEFRNPERVRELLATLEEKEHLLSVLDQVLDGETVSITFGEELGEPALRHFALVTAPYRRGKDLLGLIGVLGPGRMDYARVLPLVELLSDLVTERISA